MTVEAGPGVVFIYDLLEADDELLKALRGHRRILDEADRLLLIPPSHQERQDGLAEMGRLLHLVFLAQRHRLLRPDLLGQVVQIRGTLIELLFSPAPLREQEGFGPSPDETGGVAVSGRVPGTLDCRVPSSCVTQDTGSRVARRTTIDTNVATTYNRLERS
jgi:hypothetical protein